MTIEFHNVSFTYWQADKPALENISLEIPVGQFVVLTGATGAGKSTFLQLLNGLIPNHIPGKLEGDVLMDGLNTRQHPVIELSQKVGLVFEDPDTQIVSLTVEDDVAFGPSNLGQSIDEIQISIHEALENTRLLGFENRNPFNLSGGEKQSLAIAGILAMHPQILAMDEPTSMLDPVGRERIISILKKLAADANTTIIVVEQNPELILELADRILLFENGRIIKDGTPNEVFSDIGMMSRAGAKLPPMVEVFSQLAQLDLWHDPLPLTVNEATGMIEQKLHLETVLDSDIPLNPYLVNDPAVIIQDIEHDFGDGVVALKNISLQIPRATTTAIIGQNGSGKTTLAFHLVGILKPTNPGGHITVDGLDVHETPLTELIRHVNYVFQNPDDQLFHESTALEIEYGLKNLGLAADERKQRLNWAVERFGLQNYVNDAPKSLSRALRTKVAIAAIVSMQPAILVVDEPTSGLDRRESLEIMEVLEGLAKNGTTVIFITHEMDLVARFARYTVVMQAGKILKAGITTEIFSELEILKQASLALPDIQQLAYNLGWPDFSCLRTPDELATRIATRLVTQ